MKHFLERQRANQCNRLPRRAARGLRNGKGESSLMRLSVLRETRRLSYERHLRVACLRRACLTRDSLCGCLTILRRACWQTISARQHGQSWVSFEHRLGNMGEMQCELGGGVVAASEAAARRRPVRTPPRQPRSRGPTGAAVAGRGGPASPPRRPGAPLSEDRGSASRCLPNGPRRGGAPTPERCAALGVAIAPGRRQ